MRTLYIPFWYKSGDVRGECFQKIRVDDDGKHSLIGYVDGADKPFMLPEPHEGVLINPRNPMETLP